MGCLPNISDEDKDFVATCFPGFPLLSHPVYVIDINDSWDFMYCGLHIHNSQFWEMLFSWSRISYKVKKSNLNILLIPLVLVKPPPVVAKTTILTPVVLFWDGSVYVSS